MPGYGWIFPLGDGRINVGVGLLTTSARWKGVNTTQMLDAFCSYAPESWGISPGRASAPATGWPAADGPFGGPQVGPTHLVVGDAGGMINPFNGEGIAYGYETGRLAAEVIDEALAPVTRRAALQALRGSACRPSTGSTTGWPGLSCGPSAVLK